MGYCDQTLLLNYMGMRMDGSTSLRATATPVFGSFFGQSSLAAHALAYADNCVSVDPELDLTLLAPYGCGFQTGAGTVLNVLRPAATTASSCTASGRSAWPPSPRPPRRGSGSVVAVDPLPSRREVAARFGATTVDPAEVVDGRGRAGQGADRRRRAVRDRHHGDPRGGQAGPAVAAVRGTLVALGLGAEEYAIDAIDLLQGGKTVMASIEGDSDPQEMVPRLLGMRAAGTFPMDDLVTTYPADEVNQAVEDVTSGAVVKPVLVW